MCLTPIRYVRNPAVVKLSCAQKEKEEEFRLVIKTSVHDGFGLDVLKILNVLLRFDPLAS